MTDYTVRRAALTAGIAMVGSSLLFAQEPPAPPRPETPPPAQEEPARVQLNNVTLQQLLESVQRRTKKTFLYNDTIAGLLTQRRARIYASRDYGSPEELFAIFQSMLQVQAERFALLPVGERLHQPFTNDVLDCCRFSQATVTVCGASAPWGP